MDVNSEKGQTQFKRSVAMEDAALRAILDLFTTQWGRTSQLSSSEVMAQVLEHITAACVTVEKSTPTKESEQILHANQYLESIQKKLKKGERVPFPLVGNNLPDTINNLVTIRKSALEQPYAKDIQKRLDVFIQKLSEIQEQIRKKNILAIIVALVFGGLITWIIGGELVSDYPSASNYLLVVLAFIFFSGCSFIVARRFI